jgi:hypothetical protein
VQGRSPPRHGVSGLAEKIFLTKGICAERPDINNQETFISCKKQGAVRTRSLFSVKPNVQQSDKIYNFLSQTKCFCSILRDIMLI